MNYTYICYTSHFNDEVRKLQQVLDANNWPCVLSNYINDHKEFPGCDAETLRKVGDDRVGAIISSLWVFVFVDEKQHPTTLIEFGCALACPEVKKVHVIGERPSNSFSYHPKVMRYSNVENFISRTFFQ